MSLRKSGKEVPLSRREAIGRSALLAGASVLLAGCESVSSTARRLTGPDPAEFTALPAAAVLATGVLHAARRIGFGPRPGELHRIAEMGAKGWVEEQLGDGNKSAHGEVASGRFTRLSHVPAAGPAGIRSLKFTPPTTDEDEIGEDPAVPWRVNALDTQELQKEEPDVMFSTEYEQLLKETAQAALLRAVYSRHQLRESMADFWTNHFNIYAIKADGQAMVPTDTEKVLRPNIWDFPAMLHASAKSPAMLNYLDNKVNRKGVANENYARELLELHTLGVKSGYTLKDIQEVARCLTGWTIKTGFNRGEFEYVDSMHDSGRKYIPFLDLTVPAGGKQGDAERVIDVLATHPATGRYLARKLCLRFLGTAPEVVIEKSAAAFVASNGNVRAMLRPILLDALFDPALNKPILKRPLDLMVSSLRALAADTDCSDGLQFHLNTMGQPLYQWPMPDGFPEKSTAWTGSMLPRWNYALALTSNAIPGTHLELAAPLKAANAATDDECLDALTRTILCAEPGDAQVIPIRKQLGRHFAAARSANLPESQTIAECAGLLIASPIYQWK